MNGNEHYTTCHPTGKPCSCGEVPLFLAKVFFVYAAFLKICCVKCLKMCADYLAMWKFCVNTHILTAR